MKISLAYPKIPDSKGFLPKKCIAFEKYDGTNLHWVWNKGWTHFGTRRDRFPLTVDGINEFNKAHPGLEEAYPLFNKWADPIGEFVGYKYCPDDISEIVVFTEFLGDKSFAGMHEKDDPKKLIVIDVSSTYKNCGIIVPYQVAIDLDQYNDDPRNPSGNKIKDFHLANIIYSGKFTGQFVEDVREGKFGVKEGVVCKGDDRDGKIHMCKIKTNAYMERLKQSFNDKWKDYWE